MGLVTDLVYLREGQRRTCLATVVGTRGPSVVLDRSIHYATTRDCRHPQPSDRGEVWIGGDKRVLSRVFWDRGELRHVVRGVVPAPGTRVNCHLDGERRDDASAAHTAMHLVVSAFARRRLGVLAGPCEVQGRRQFTLTTRWTAWSPQGLRDLLDAANAAASRRLEVTIAFAPRDGLHGVEAQPFEDGVAFPGSSNVVRLVRVGDASALPCDGTHVERTAKLGRIVVRRVRPLRDQVQVQFHVA